MCGLGWLFGLKIVWMFVDEKETEDGGERSFLSSWELGSWKLPESSLPNAGQTTT